MERGEKPEKSTLTQINVDNVSLLAGSRSSLEEVAGGNSSGTEIVIISSSEQEMIRTVSSEQELLNISSSEQEKTATSDSEREMGVSSISEHDIAFSSSSTPSSSKRELAASSSSERELAASSSSERELAASSSSERELAASSSSERELAASSSSERELNIMSSSERETAVILSSKTEVVTTRSSPTKMAITSSSEMEVATTSSSGMEIATTNSSEKGKQSDTSSSERQVSRVEQVDNAGSLPLENTEILNLNMTGQLPNVPERERSSSQTVVCGICGSDDQLQNPVGRPETDAGNASSPEIISSMDSEETLTPSSISNDITMTSEQEQREMLSSIWQISNVCGGITLSMPKIGAFLRDIAENYQKDKDELERLSYQTYEIEQRARNTMRHFRSNHETLNQLSAREREENNSFMIETCSHLLDMIKSLLRKLESLFNRLMFSDPEIREVVMLQCSALDSILMNLRICRTRLENDCRQEASVEHSESFRETSESTEDDDPQKDTRSKFVDLCRTITSLIVVGIFACIVKMAVEYIQNFKSWDDNNL